MGSARFRRCSHSMRAETSLTSTTRSADVAVLLAPPVISIRSCSRRLAILSASSTFLCLRRRHRRADYCSSRTALTPHSSARQHTPQPNHTALQGPPQGRPAQPAHHPWHLPRSHPRCSGGTIAQRRRRWTICRSRSLLRRKRCRRTWSPQCCGRRTGSRPGGGAASRTVGSGSVSRCAPRHAAHAALQAHWARDTALMCGLPTASAPQFTPQHGGQWRG